MATQAQKKAARENLKKARAARRRNSQSTDESAYN